MIELLRVTASSFSRIEVVTNQRGYSKESKPLNAKVMENDNITLVTKITCQNTFSNKVYLTDYQRFVIIALNILLMIFNLLANSAVLIILILSKFCQNTSYILLFYLSLSDCLSSLVAQPIYLALIVQYFDQPNCTVEIIANFFGIVLSHTSVYGIATIAFDRYIRMRYLNRYQFVVNKQRVIITCCIITSVSICDGLIYALGTEFSVFYISTTIVKVVDFFVFTSIVVTYLLTVKIVRDHLKKSTNRRLLQNVNRTVTKLASRMLVLLFSSFGMYTIIYVIYSVYIKKVENSGKSWPNFALFCTYLIMYCNSLANAVLFLINNKKVKEKFYSFQCFGGFRKASTTMSASACTFKFKPRHSQTNKNLKQIKTIAKAI